MAGIFSRYLSSTVYFYVAGVGLAAGYIKSVLPDTYYVEEYMDRNSAYKDNEMVPVSKDTESLIKKILHRLDLDHREEAVLKFFTCTNKDPISKGSLKHNSIVHTGAVIGLPTTFYCETEEEIEENFNIQNGFSIDWKSEEGKALKKFILLTEQEKAFAISREIYFSNTAHLFVDMTFKVFLFVIAYSAVYYLENTLGWNKRLQLLPRTCFYSLIAVFFISAYYSFLKSYFLSRENRVDYKAARLSPYYAKGGLSYYEKVLGRNVMLREILGKEGEALYTPKGNVVADLNQPKVPLTIKKNNLQSYVQQWEEGKFSKLS